MIKKLKEYVWKKRNEHRNRFLFEFETRIESIEDRKFRKTCSKYLIAGLIPDTNLVKTIDIADILERKGYIKIVRVDGKWKMLCNEFADIRYDKYFTVIRTAVNDAFNTSSKR